MLVLGSCGLGAPFRSAPTCDRRPLDDSGRAVGTVGGSRSTEANEMFPMHQQERATDTNSFCIEQQWWPTEVPEESDG